MASVYPLQGREEFHNTFYEAFVDLVDDAQVDFPTEEQYRRIADAWLRAGRPVNVDEFIWERMQA